MKRLLFMLLIPLVLLSGCYSGNTLINAPSGSQFIITDRLTGETYTTKAYNSGGGSIIFVHNGITILIRDNYKVAEVH